MAFQSIQHLIQRLEHQEAWQTHQRFQRVLSVWSSVVGAIVAARTRPIGIQQGTLHVAVCNAAWAQNLAFERQRILQKLNTCFPKASFTDIRFSTVQWNYSDSRTSTLQTENNPEIQELWRSHPSTIHPPSDQADYRRLSVVPKKPEDAFQKWAERIQRRSQYLPLCPTCQCPTPEGELRRWKQCALCTTKKWKTETCKQD